MKFLIAGFGSIGRRHFRNLLSLGEKDILFYRTNKSVLADDELEGYLVISNLEEALNHNPDAVIVSNPTALHLDVAIPAARAGCDILLEKPVSHNMERVDHLKKIVEQNGSKVLVGFQFRFHPGLKKIKEIISSGEIGRPLSVRAHWGEYLPDWHPWEDYRKSYSARKDLGGGVVLTLCHPFDYVRWILGEVVELWSLIGTESDLEIKVEDTAEIGLRTVNGTIVSIHLNFTQKPPKHTMEIVGTQGAIFWDYYQGVVNFCSHDPDNAAETFSVDSDFVRNHLFLNEMEHFIEVIRGNVEPVCSLGDGIRALEIALAALQPKDQRPNFLA